jgi:hypothetical protein
MIIVKVINQLNFDAWLDSKQKQINLAMSKALHVIDLPFCKCKIKFKMSISFLQMQVIKFVNVPSTNAKLDCQCLLCG